MELFVSEILLSNEIIIYLFIQIILFILLFIAFYFSIFIIKNWNYEKTTSAQYKLEKTSYLVILIIFFALIVKIFLMPYFTYSIDNLSHIIPGAMCAAGVIKANSYGEILLALKLIIVFCIGVWLIINSLDLKEKTYPYTKKKFVFYVFIFALILIETTLDILYLSNISTKEPVQCCSVIFGANSVGSKIPFNLTISMLVGLFYLLYLLTIFTNIQKQIDEMVLKALELANINHKKDELIYNLSGGEKQRCAIARAIANDPEIILCDEPTANLDYDNSIIFIESLKLMKSLNKIIIVATHDPIFDNLDFVDEIINIKNGMICE